jgi:predicted regulator of Ras-like GTPase activity (Roadblock/LC7/MglB family)
MSDREAMQEALGPLRDVPHVRGCFVFSDLGRILGRDLSALFGDEVLAAVAPRALRLRETFSRPPEEFRSCTLRYVDHLLLLRPLRDGLLCVLASNDVNELSLRMGITLAIRRLNAVFDAPAVS